MQRFDLKVRWFDSRAHVMVLMVVEEKRITLFCSLSKEERCIRAETETFMKLLKYLEVREERL